MTISTKFNLVLAFVFAIGLSVVGYVSNYVLQENAREEVIRHADMMMEAALAIRSYTIKEVKPLLSKQLEKKFLPQTVPSYAATQNFNALREKNPEYSYKEATLNPTNPRDRATDWETDIIQQFSNDNQIKEVIGERETPGGTSLYLARPIRITDEACLACHSTVDSAPMSMRKLYGEANGFGWQHNEVVGSQIVSVPLSLPVKKADETFRIFMASMLIIFLCIFVLLNLMLRKFIIRPVVKMSHIADEVSNGNMDAPAFIARGNDEITQLATSFERMRISLEKAMKMLS
ncbi:DUF3365 domain-containing protein [Sulfuriflexus sp.]|uniref:c-type heme family protein n=1 Tax=Sulfuriflexus sp. TaxID=2015443 RepID=UPI0028CD4A22|nr:DUF3365 domain-containing protein [Sulfuriflexus sp.]MDT8403367.1 DUF3365 domain-containing protein [Sulfuriflexus sp.]